MVLGDRMNDSRQCRVNGWMLKIAKFLEALDKEC
jgi:hypothetical protein